MYIHDVESHSLAISPNYLAEVNRFSNCIWTKFSLPIEHTYIFCFYLHLFIDFVCSYATSRINFICWDNSDLRKMYGVV